MVTIRMGVKRALIIPKKICEEQKFSAGDLFNIDIKDGKIILSKINNKVSFESIKKVKKKRVKSVEYSKSINKIEQKSLKELNEIPLSGSAEFKPNLIESINYSRKYYSKCGLLCRTKNKYIENYCNSCRGQMLAENVRELYCPYVEKKIVNKQDRVVNVDKQVDNINNNIGKLTNILDNQIKALNNACEDVNIDTVQNNTIEVVKYKHHHQCYGCNEYFDVGFMVGDEHFYCKACASNLFKNYMKEKGKLRNV